MPFPVLPLPSVFNLPQIAGVPDVIGRVVPPQVTGIVSSSLGAVYDEWILRKEKQLWGFYLPSSETPINTRTPLRDKSSGTPAPKPESGPVLTSSSFMTLNVQEAYAISDAPQEDGAFVSYNKVKSPTKGRVKLVCDGFQTGASLVVAAIGKSRSLWDANARPEAVRKQFLAALGRMASDTRLYTLKTPEGTWDRVNITGYTVSYEAGGTSTILYAEVSFAEVRSTSTNAFATSKKVQGAEVVDNGVTTPAKVETAA